MKRCVLAAVIVLSIAGGVSCAADTQEAEKDWCLLGVSNKCAGTTTIDLFDKIRRLNVAIGKGAAVYTPEELERLKRMLAEAQVSEDILFRTGK